MNVFYEEEGTLKVGAVLADNATTLQVEAPHGKRSKIKAAGVLLRFEPPRHSPTSWRRRSALADELDLDFLWQCSSGEEFGFERSRASTSAARPRPPKRPACCSSSTARRCTSTSAAGAATRRRPRTALKAALASVERKSQQALQKDGYVAQLVGGALSRRAFEPILNALLYKPDRNTIEWKALEEASVALKLDAARADRALRRAAVDARLPPQPLSLRALSARGRVPDMPAAGTPIATTCRCPTRWRSASTTPRPPRSTMRSR